MRKITVLALAAALTVAAALPAGAKAGDVIRRGPCGASSDWKLKLSPEDNGIQVEFEVDQNVSGDTWRVRMFHDGVRFFAGTRTTGGASGSFTVRRIIDDRAGTDKVLARAVNPSTSEVCRGTATI